jgi:hypothetical protein
MHLNINVFNIFSKQVWNESNKGTMPKRSFKAM